MSLISLKRRLLPGQLACGVLLGFYSWILFANICFAVGGADSSGYANAARLMLRGQLIESVDALNQVGLDDSFLRLFIPLGFIPGPRPGTMVPSYPPSFPLHIVASVLATGWTYGPFLVSPLAALFCLVLLYLSGREFGLSRTWSAAGAAILAVCPVFLFQAVQPMSDVVATAWTLAAILAALRSRRSPGWAVAAGAAFGLAVLTRPTSVLLAVPILLAIRPQPKTLGLFLVGGLPFAGFFLAYNRAAYGNALQPGYGAGYLGETFALSFFPERLLHYSYWLAATMSPLLPLGWLAVTGDQKVPRRNRALLVSWFGVFLLFYCFYRPYEAWWYTRFLLPGIPAMILAALLVARNALGFSTGNLLFPRLQQALAILLFLMVLGTAIGQNGRLGVLGINEGESVYPVVSRWAQTVLPDNALVATMQTSGALKFYTNRIYVRWDWLEPKDFPFLRSHTEAMGYRWYALLFPFEVEELHKRLPGRWKKVDTLRNISLWQLEPDLIHTPVPPDKRATPPQAGE